MNILIVDDDEFLQKSLSFHLLQAGHSVRIAANGKAALEALKNDVPVQALICDVNMPELTGAGLILSIKHLYPSNRPKIIFVSGIKDGEAFLKKIDITYDRYFEKPLDLQKLEALQQYLIS